MSDDKKTILYIDDDPDFIESMRIILEANGYDMVDASTAEEGLKVYKEAKPDLVIVDLMMEEIDAGTNFVKEVKALGDKPPMYMLSSVGDELNLSTDYKSLGLDGVFQKPIDTDKLLKTLERKLA